MPLVNLELHEVSIVAPVRPSFVDITPHLLDAVQRAGIDAGSVTAYCTHTTCGLVVNEWEDGALEDVLARLEMLVPSDGYYAHDDLGRRTQNLHPNEPVNGRAHVAQMLLGGTSITVPVSGGLPALGRWQRLMLLELDTPKPRTVLFQTLGVAPVDPPPARPLHLALEH